MKMVAAMVVAPRPPDASKRGRSRVVHLATARRVGQPLELRPGQADVDLAVDHRHGSRHRSLVANGLFELSRN